MRNVGKCVSAFLFFPFRRLFLRTLRFEVEWEWRKAPSLLHDPLHIISLLGALFLSFLLAFLFLPVSSGVWRFFTFFLL